MTKKLSGKHTCASSRTFLIQSGEITAEEAALSKVNIESEGAVNKLVVSTELGLKPEDIKGPEWKKSLAKYQSDLEEFGEVTAKKNAQQSFLENQKNVKDLNPKSSTYGKTGYEIYLEDYQKTNGKQK